MPKPAKGHRLGSGPSHERLLLKGLAQELFRVERIRTTQAKAMRLRPVAERLITLGKSGTVHSRRRALAMIPDREIIHKVFSDIAPRYSERSGGYTRVLKLGPRQGDAAPMAIIELVEGQAPDTAGQETGEAKRRRLGRRKSGKPVSGEAGSGGRRSRRDAKPADDDRGTKTEDKSQPDDSAATGAVETAAGPLVIPDAAADKTGQTLEETGGDDAPGEPTSVS